MGGVEDVGGQDGLSHRQGVWGRRECHSPARQHIVIRRVSHSHAPECGGDGTGHHTCVALHRAGGTRRPQGTDDATRRERGWEDTPVPGG